VTATVHTVRPQRRCCQLSTTDGLTLSAAAYDRPEPKGAVVVAHGFTGSQDQPEVRALADAIRDAGYAVVTFDGRGHGESEGLCTLGTEERYDVGAAVGLARSMSPHVAVVGASMGGIAVLHHAVDDPQLAGVIAVSTPAVWKLPRSARGVLSALVTRTKVGRRLIANRAGVRVSPVWLRVESPSDLVARLRVPLVVIHGRADRFLAKGHAEDLYRAAARGRRRMIIVPGMGHAFGQASMASILDGLRWLFGEGGGSAEGA
jgi:pimeloyl-ACP methyl ester carboxylesterase